MAGAGECERDCGLGWLGGAGVKLQRCRLDRLVNSQVEFHRCAFERVEIAVLFRDSPDGKL